MNLIPKRPVLVILTGHWLSLLGSGLVTTAVITWIFILPMEFGGHAINPYIGIIVFIVVPIVFFSGLIVMIPVGVWLSKRRVSTGLARIEMDRRTLINRLLLFLVVSTALNIIIGTQLTYRAVRQMDTVQFCGQTCHVMAPVYSAYVRSAHSNAGCTECHIAPGAAGWFQAKMNGARQLMEVTLNNYPRPIPPPIESGRLVSPRDSCEGCHNVRNAGTNRLKVITHYTDDQATKPLRTVLMIRSSADPQGSVHGIHLAPGTSIRFVSSDRKRENIPWVEYRNSVSKTVRAYSSDSQSGFLKIPAIEMTCVDCHNSPAHTFRPAESVVDTALAAGDLPSGLPFIRKVSLEAVQATYKSQREASVGISKAITAYYAANPVSDSRQRASRAADVQKAAAVLADLYKQNVYPDLGVGWGTYPNQLGHTESTGCFRCHDGSHIARDGAVITQDCNACHQILASGEASPAILKDLGLENAIAPPLMKGWPTQ